jgi:hypothetical protein
MEVKLNTILKDLDGKDIIFTQGVPATKDTKEVPAVYATVGKMTIEALMATYKDEENLSGEDKLKRWQLAVRVKNSSATGTIQMTAEEVSLVKKLIGKAYGIMIVGQVWELLEGAK